MLTIKKLKIYKKYSGNIDGWARTGKKSEQSLKDEDWTLIDGLIQDIELIEGGLTSESFKIKTYLKLTESCDNEKTQKYLISLVEK